jgi:hypothetical protein
MSSRRVGIRLLYAPVDVAAGGCDPGLALRILGHTEVELRPSRRVLVRFGRLRQVEDVHADVPEPDPHLGQHRDAGFPRPWTKRIAFGQGAGVRSLADPERREVRHQRLLELPVQRRQWAGKEGGELPRPHLRVQAADERLAVGAEVLNVVGVEHDIGIDPDQFVEAVGEGVGGHLVAGGIDGRVAADAADCASAALQFVQGVVAGRLKVRVQRHEEDGADGVASGKGQGEARERGNGRI